jgi:hypothetical protein
MSGNISNFFQTFEDGSSYIGAFLEMLGFSSEAAALWADRINQAVTSVINGFTWFVNQLQTNKPLVISILAVIGAAFLAWGVTVAIAAATALAPMLPVIAIIAAIGVAVYLLAKAWEANWGGIREKTAAVVDFVKKGISGWVQLFTITVPNAINNLKVKWITGFDGIRASIQRVVDFAQKLRDKLMNISLPSWLTPGSPTPFEIGLLGIADALKIVNGTGFDLGVPNAINLQQPNGVSRVASTPNTNAEKTVNYNTTINNPVGETTEKSQRKALKKLSYLGVPQS